RNPFSREPASWTLRGTEKGASRVVRYPCSIALAVLCGRRAAPRGVRVPSRLPGRRSRATTTVKRKRWAPRVVVPELVLAEATDGELVAAHLGGHPGAFTELYDRYRDKLVHFIARKTGDRDRAEDLVQEAFIRVTRHLHRFDQSKKFSTWIYTICSNLAKNELRNRSRNPLVLFQK